MNRPLVSADDVRDARGRRLTRLVVPAGAIVTPLARDEAARWGIELVEGTESRGEGTGAAPASGARAATCDPDDVDRVVRRVMAKVPDADPARVREIARRALEELG